MSNNTHIVCVQHSTTLSRGLILTCNMRNAIRFIYSRERNPIYIGCYVYIYIVFDLTE